MADVKKCNTWRMLPYSPRLRPEQVFCQLEDGHEGPHRGYQYGSARSWSD